MTLTTEKLNEIYENPEQCSYSEIQEMGARLANQEAQPVAWTVGGFSTHDKKWAERRSEEDNLLLEPLYRHPVITGIDKNHYDPELEPGLYVAEIMTKGGAAVINGYYTAPPAPAVPDEMKRDPDADVFDPGFMNGWNACRAAMLAQPVSGGYKLPPHLYRELVNSLRDTAVKFSGTEQLRERLNTALSQFIEPDHPHTRTVAPEGGN
ncbi:hypothetical protein SME04J_04470 [Serratia marcescens]|nr:hypothetical protein SME04J_04470 [Serratia marcescens]